MSMQICSPTVAGFVSFCQNKLPKSMAGRLSLANMAINRPFSRDFLLHPHLRFACFIMKSLT